MLVHWIWFATRSGLGDHAKKMLLERFESPENLYFASRAELASIGSLSPKAREELADRDLTESEKILRACTDLRIHVLTYQDAAYPNRLRNIPDPPMVLYYKGTLPEFDTVPTIGIVGTRRASVYGLTTGKQFGYQIAACGGLVVSGIAMGIDAMAMQGALTAGGSVVAVLGCGADIVYPPQNRALYADTERHGCLLTEYPPGTPPIGRHFPIRNRIISGLSCGVLVVEAPEGSGALITARRAADQGRDVFVVPANIDNPASAGSNQLLRDGASAVGTGWDVMEEYRFQFPDRVRKGGMGVRLRAYPDEVMQAAEEGEKRPLKVAQKPRKPAKTKMPEHEKTKKVIDNDQIEPYIDLNKIDSSLTGDERTITDLLRDGQRLADDIIAESGLGAGTVMATLTLLEVKGIIRRLPGRYFVLAGRK